MAEMKASEWFAIGKTLVEKAVAVGMVVATMPPQTHPDAFRDEFTAKAVAAGIDPAGVAGCFHSPEWARVTIRLSLPQIREKLPFGTWKGDLFIPQWYEQHEELMDEISQDESAFAFLQEECKRWIDASLQYVAGEIYVEKNFDMIFPQLLRELIRDFLARKRGFGDLREAIS